MRIRPKLLALARAVAAEAEQNAPFRKQLEECFESKPSKKAEPKEVASKRPSHRRKSAVLDPVGLYKRGDDLTAALKALGIEQLKDIVAEYGMDPSKLVMKWKDEQKIIDHIVEISASRSRKGDAFRS